MKNYLPAEIQLFIAVLFLFLFPHCNMPQNDPEYVSPELVLPKGIETGLDIQNVLEKINIPGTMYKLHYSGNRTAGFNRDSVSPSNLILFGWTITPYHAFDTDTKTLYLGDGSVQKIEHTFSSAKIKQEEFLVYSNDGNEIYHFDKEGKHLSTFDPVTLNKLWSFQHNPSGKIIIIKDRFGYNTTLVYKKEKISEIKSSSNITTNFSYDDFPERIKISSKGYMNIWLHHTRDRLLSRFQNPNGFDRVYQYDENGLVRSQTDEQRSVTFTKQTGKNGNLIKKFERKNGKILTTEVATSTNEGSVLVTKTLPDGTQMKSTFQNGRIVEISRPDGSREQYSWKEAPLAGNNLPYIGELTETDSDGKMVKTFIELKASYKDDDPLQVEDYQLIFNQEGKSISTRFAVSKKQLEMYSSTGDSTVYTFNNMNQLIEENKPGLAPKKYRYDLKGRLVKIIHGNVSNARISSFAYPVGKKQIEVTNPIGQKHLLTVNSFGLISQVDFSDKRKVRLNYTPNGHLATLQMPKGQLRRLPEKDMGKRRGVQVSKTYHSKSGISAKGKFSEERDYNEFGEIAKYTATFEGKPVISFEYTYDKMGRIIRITETDPESTKTLEYGYSEAGYLEEVKQNGSLINRYSYDANGNRTKVIRGNSIKEARFNEEDQLVGYGEDSFEYNPLGQLVNRSANGNMTVYAYDKAGRCNEARLPEGKLIEYTTDHKDRRTGKKVNGVLVGQYQYDELNRLVAELDKDGNEIARFEYRESSHSPHLLITNNQSFRIISDHLGSPRIIINGETGAIVQKLDYDSFGNIETNTSPGFQPLGFAGGLFDEDTGLTHFGARDYDPLTGRWTAKDPLLFDGGSLNLYAYADNNPVNLVDITGTQSSPPSDSDGSLAGWLAKRLVTIGVGAGLTTITGLESIIVAIFTTSEIAVSAGIPWLAAVEMAVWGPALFHALLTIAAAWMVYQILSALWEEIEDWAAGWGDPHMNCPDGSSFDFQAVGEFTVLKTRDGTFEIQARQQPIGNSRTVSRTNALVVKNGNDRIGFYLEPEMHLIVNGLHHEFFEGELDGGTTVQRTGHRTYRIITPKELICQVNMNATFLNYQIGLGTEMKGKTYGLLGQYDGNPKNDFTTREGETLEIPTDRRSEEYFNTLYKNFGHSWRITEEESLFHYGDGESTKSFTDLSFPSKYTDADDLDESTRQMAEAVCRRAGFAETTGLNNCILDVGLTGDTTYAVPVVPIVEGVSFSGESIKDLPDEPEVPLGNGFEVLEFREDTVFKLGGMLEIANGDLRMIHENEIFTSVWASFLYDRPQPIAQGFETQFEFSIQDINSEGSDGFAFIVGKRSDGTAQLYGYSFRECAFEGIPNILAIEFDTRKDPFDPSDNHISIHYAAAGGSNNCDDETHSKASTSDIVNFSDGKRHKVKIRYANHQLTVYLDDMNKAVLTLDVDLEKELRLDKPGGFVGFVASSRRELGKQTHVIHNWVFKPMKSREVQ